MRTNYLLSILGNFETSETSRGWDLSKIIVGENNLTLHKRNMRNDRNRELKIKRRVKSGLHPSSNPRATFFNYSVTVKILAFNFFFFFGCFVISLLVLTFVRRLFHLSIIDTNKYKGNLYIY